MAMFDKHKSDRQEGHQSNSPESAKDRATGETSASFKPGKTGTIGPGITIIGDISGDENLIIEGTVEGRIDLGTHEVTIGKTGRLKADVVAKSVRIDGSLEGDIIGNDRVLISRRGTVEGNIVAPRLILEDGAIFRGSVEMTPSPPEKKEAPRSVQKPPVAPSEPLKTTKPVAVDHGRKEAGFATKGG